MFGHLRCRGLSWSCIVRPLHSVDSFQWFLYDLVWAGWKFWTMMKLLQEMWASGHREIVFPLVMACAPLLTIWNYYFIDFRIDVWWRSKNQDAMLQAYKIDLQHMVGSKLPAALLKFYYCFSLRRRVRYRLLSFLLRVTASGEEEENKMLFSWEIFALFWREGQSSKIPLEGFFSSPVASRFLLSWITYILSCVVSTV